MEAQVRSPTIEKLFAYSLIVNGVLGLIFMSMGLIAIINTAVAMPLVAVPLPFIGIASGVLALREKSAALLLGVVFYAVQCVRYYSAAISLGFTSGFQFGFAFHPSPETTVVVNILAVGFTLFGVIVLTEHFSSET